MGPVSDSWAAGAGIVAAPSFAGLDRLRIEVWGLVSKDVRDRDEASCTTTGRGLLGRLGAEWHGWRAQVLAWSARDFLKEEGDPNYLAALENGIFVRAPRTDGELGLARFFEVAPGFKLEPSFRLHLVNSDLEYSYRLVGRMRFDLPLLK